MKIARLRTPLVCLTSILTLVGCSSPHSGFDDNSALMKEAFKGTGAQRMPYTPSSTEAESAANLTGRSGARQQIIKGSNTFVQRAADNSPAPSSTQGDISLNFSNQPIEAVVNSVLGDLLHVSYTIAPGVTGDVSFSTATPVSRQEALSILETLLSWSNNALIKQGDSYVVLPASKAIAGKLVPQMPLSAPANGLSARLFPLKYISATEMQKLLKPYANDDTFLSVDPSRNMLSLAGTPEELNNYQRTIETFDVNWLKGMSIGVFALEHASVTELMPQIKEVFGPNSDTPLAGMVKFLPVERTNSIVAISSQPEYLNDIGDWIRTIDNGGGNEPQLYVYDVRNMKAVDLAKYLQQIYGTQQANKSDGAKVAPGLQTKSLSSLNTASTSTLGSNATSADASDSQDQESNTQADDASTDSDSDSADDDGQASGGGGNEESDGSLDQSIRISAEKNSNQLLVRTRPSQWKEIEAAIHRLDNMPMQVQIETRILEVNLTGDLDMGVQWYLGRLAGNSSSTTVANASGSQGALGGGGAGLSSTDSMFYSFVSSKLQVALHALETSGRTQVLSAPSLVVMNNQKAKIQVGDDIPISQTSISTTTSTSTVSSVEYVQTGVILSVVPRINPGGLVYMDINQQVSDAATSSTSSSTTDSNPTISTRSVATQVAVQSGQTVLLGGLIKQNDSQTNSSVPYLGRIPGLGWLFGNSSKSHSRTELVVLITPRVISNNNQARQVTDEYSQQMQLLKPNASQQ